ncbi:MAG: glycosyltransferase [Bryobacteraceae bacterium]
MKRKIEVAFFGSSLVSAYWNGAATYYRGIIRALHGRSYNVTFYEPDAYDRQRHADMPPPAWARVVVYPASGSDGVGRALEEARGADVLVKASGVGVYDDLLDRAILQIRRPGAAAIFWDVDAPATLDRVHRIPRDPFRELIPRYDAIFTYGGGRPVVNSYRSLGARLCVPVYNAHDPETHFPVPPESRFQADLSFLGNRLPDREARVDEFFFRAAIEAPKSRFLLAGSGWEGKPMPPNVTSLGHLFTRDHNAFNSSARAVLNISRESMAQYGFSPATRVFEAAAAGACLITDDWEGVGEFLEPESEVLVVRDGGGVAELLRTLSAERARQIGQAARRRVLADHTYDSRASLIDAMLTGRLTPIRSAAGSAAGLEAR